MQTIKQEHSFLISIRCILVVSLLLVGGYYEWGSALITISLLILLCQQCQKKAITFHLNDAMIAVLVLSGFYLLSALWAVDHGMALWGFVKYMPLPLFGLCLMQLKADERKTLLFDLPWLGAIMTFFSLILQYIPFFKSSLLVSGRLGGFLQYPNTYGIFLVIGLIVLLYIPKTEQKIGYARLLCGGLLVIGLMAADSRACMLIAVVMILIALILQHSKQLYLQCFGSIIIGAIYTFMTNILQPDTTLAHLSAGGSTFWGRILYWHDALPVIASHPLGLGYLGYYFTQASFQTGVYSVRWVHNGLLQIALDIGWIPAILCIIAIFKAVFSKHSSSLQRIVLCTLVIHALFDFDLEFIAIYLILLLCLDWDDMKARTLNLSIAVRTALCLFVGCFSCYIGMASLLHTCNHSELAAKIYPWDTLAHLDQLILMRDLEQQSQLADRILAQNKSVALAWDVKANAAYAVGDFSSVISAKRKAISLSRYAISEYEDFFQKLQVGVTLYGQAGDTKSAEVCLQEILGIQDLLDAVSKETSPLAYRINDQPILTMSDGYQTYVDRISQ